MIILLTKITVRRRYQRYIQGIIQIDNNLKSFDWHTITRNHRFKLISALNDLEKTVNEDSNTTLYKY